MVEFKLMKIHVQREYYTNRHPSHDWTHVEEQFIYSRQIYNRLSDEEKAQVNMDVVNLATLWSDVIRTPRDAAGDEILSANALREYMAHNREKYDYALIKVSKAVEAVLRHSRSSRVSPFSLEDKIVYDADKLDAYGERGVKRFVSMFKSEENALAKYLKGAIALVQKKKIAYTKPGLELAIPKIRNGLDYIEQRFKELGKNAPDELQTARELLDNYSRE